MPRVCRLLLLILQVLSTSSAQSPEGERLEGSGQDLAGIPGRAGSDYPTLSQVPRTSFSCVGRVEGFYADEEARCQVFHVCGLSSGPRPQQSFLCPNGTLFNMLVKTCDWWNNVQCGEDPLLEERQPLASGEPTPQAATLNNQESLGSSKNPNDSTKANFGNEEKMHFDRNKFLLNAFKIKVDTTESSGSKFTYTLAAKVDQEPGLRSVVREEGFPQEVRNNHEVTIRPRIKYTHSIRASTTKRPIFSVKTYLEPTEDTLLGLNDSSDQHKYTEIIRNNSEQPKNTNQLNENNYHSEKVSPKVAKISEHYPIMHNEELYKENIIRPKAHERYPVPVTTNTSQVTSKIIDYSSVRQEGKSSNVALHQTHKEKKDFLTYDRKTMINKVINKLRTSLDEATLTTKSDVLSAKEGVNSNKNENSRLQPLYSSYSSSSNNYFNFNQFGTSKSHDIHQNSLNSEIKETNNNLQTLHTPNSFESENLSNTERKQEFSISKQNFTYEEYTESLPEYHQIEPELLRNTKNTSNSYVNVPSFSSFPELYTSSVSGYYITELPSEIKQLAPNFMKNYDDKNKSRPARLDGESYKLESTSEISLESNRDLVLSETESIYATPKSTTTHGEFESDYHNVESNFDSPDFRDSLVQVTPNTLQTENNEENNSFKNEAILGPEISFENSHIAWPIFPPRSVFYSPYPALKQPNSQLGPTELLSFFPHPPRRYRVNVTNNNENNYNYAKHDQDESGEATEKYSSSTQSFDLAKVLREFLSNSPNSYSDTQASTMFAQPALQVYSESTTSGHLEDTSLKLGSPSSDVTPLETKQRNNDSPNISAVQSSENVPLFDEKYYDNVRKELKNDNFVGMKHTSSRIANDHFKTDHKSRVEQFEPQKPLLLSSEPSYTLSSAQSHSLKTVLEPPDVLNINSLQASSETTAEESFKGSEVVKSLSFDLDSPEDREQFEAAQSRGLLERCFLS